MRLIKIMGIAVVAVLAMSVMATGASAHVFESSTTGLLTANAHSPQLFRFPSGEVVCTTLVGHGKVVSLSTLTQVATVQYKSCTSGLGTVTEPINAEYEFNADESVAVLKNIVVNVTAFGAKCIVTVLPQSKLKTVSYKNLGSGVLLSANIKGIVSDGSGALCNWTNDNTGEYTGSALVGLTGGTITWK